MIKYITLTFLLLLSLIAPVFVQSHENKDGILSDSNEDGLISIATFGDSITFGIGDNIAPGEVVEMAPMSIRPAGYPLRLSRDIGIVVENGGLPGELFTEGGSLRALQLLQASPADLFLLLEGTNDGVFRVSPTLYSLELQKVVNIARVLGKRIVPMTLPVPCCDRAGQALFTDAYSSAIREIGVVNEMDVIDIESAWKRACPVAEDCSLLNRPEGIHPNTAGYDFISDIILPILVGEQSMESEQEESVEEEESTEPEGEELS